VWLVGEQCFPQFFRDSCHTRRSCQKSRLGRPAYRSVTLRGMEARLPTLADKAALVLSESTHRLPRSRTDCSAHRDAGGEL
jgi:hypothetical protein